jgi:hypothetical protein
VLRAPWISTQDFDQWMRSGLAEVPDIESLRIEAGFPDSPANDSAIDAEARSKGPASPLEGASVEEQPSAEPVRPRGLHPKAPMRRAFLRIGLPLLGLAALSVSLLAPRMPLRGTQLSGRWSRSFQGWNGESAAAGRFSTRFLVGPGSSIRVPVQPRGGEWSGGIEIFQDETHWTFLNLSPTTHEIVAVRMPSGSLDRFASPSVGIVETTEIELRIRADFVEVGVAGDPVHRLPLEASDVAEGRLVFRTGRDRHEWGGDQPGRAFFGRPQIESPLPSPSCVVPRPLSGRSTPSRYVVFLSNVDDQEDLLLDGCRVATVDYLQKTEVDLSPFLVPGDHELRVRVFNRQMSATYGVRFERDGATLWRSNCGVAGRDGGGCPELGSRLGMIHEMTFRFGVAR